MATQNNSDTTNAETLAQAAKDLGVSFVQPAGAAAAATTAPEKKGREEIDQRAEDDEDEEEKKRADDAEDEDENEKGASAEDDEEESDDDKSDENEDDEKSDDEDEEESDEKEDDDEEDDDKAEDPAKDAKAAAAKALAKGLKNFEPEQRKQVQSVVDGIVANIVKGERAETERLGGRVTELTQQLEQAEKKHGPTIVGSVHPMFLVDEEAGFDERLEKIEKFLDWADANKDGVEAKGEPGEKDYEPAIAAEAIRERARELRKERDKIIPAARENLKTRAQIEANLKRVYPKAFDPKSEEYAAINTVLKRLPELKQFADMRVIALKQFLGDRALAELIKQQKEKKPSGQEQRDPKKPKKPVPRAPGGGSPAKGSAFEPKAGGKPNAAKAVEKFTKGEGTLEDAVAALI